MSIDLTVREQLDRLDVAYELFPCDPALADTAAFCAAYDFKPEDAANTIVVIGKSDTPVLRRLRRAGQHTSGRQSDGSSTPRNP